MILVPNFDLSVETHRLFDDDQGAHSDDYDSMTTNHDMNPTKGFAITRQGMALVILFSPVAGGQVIPIDPVSGVTASSEIGGGFDRQDDYLVDGSGLVGDGHIPTVEGNMWLSRGTAFGGEDLDPQVVFDFGANYRVTGIRVWNYNEAPPNLTGRGVNEVTVEYGATLDFGATVPGISRFALADGTNTYEGEIFEDFEPFTARYIRFDIASNHGGDNQFYGLSEVQFEGELVGVSLSNPSFLSSAPEGAVVGEMTTSPAEPGESYQYELVTGDGDDDNGKFATSGDGGAQLVLGSFDFSGAPDGQVFSLRIRSTASPSGEEVESILQTVVLLDSDGDALADRWEQRWAPGNLALLSGLGGADADSDGLTDLEEYELREQFPDLDPTVDDSDGDGLLDGEELAGAGDRPATDPTLADTDGDGLGDLVESNSGSFVDADDSGTNPTLADTDEDGADDGKEITAGSDPNDPDSLPQVFLAAYWDFESDVDPQPDRSEFGNDAAVFVGASWTNDGERGGVMEFDGFDSYLEAADSESLSIEGDLSIAAWVRLADFNGFRGIVGKTAGVEGNQPAPYDLYFLQDAGQLRFFTGSPDGFAQVTGASIPILDQWHHVAVTRIDDEVTLYFDGEVDASGIVAAPMVDADGSLRIGNREDFVTDFFGRLDDVAIFNGGLTPEQVMAVMSGDFSRFGLGGGELQLRVSADESGLRFEWESRSGKVYDLVSSADLATAPSTWPVYQVEGLVYGDIPGTDSTIVRENVPFTGGQRFFALVEKNP